LRNQGDSFLKSSFSTLRLWGRNLHENHRQE
jgi:hypothetical protein